MIMGMDGLVLLAAGPSRRFGGSTSKVLKRVAGKPMIVRALSPFLVAVESLALVIVARPQDHPTIKRHLPRANLVAGGSARVSSLLRGVAALPEGVDVVLVHDASRPLAPADLVRRVLAAARRDGAAAPVVAVRDSLHHVVQATDGGPSLLEDTLDRGQLGAAQSPQAARRGLLVRALNAHKKNADGASLLPENEVALLQQAGIPVTAVRGHPHNIRITHPEDLELAEGLLQRV